MCWQTVPDELAGSLSEHLKVKCTRHYGWAGPEFLRFIIEQLAKDEIDEEGWLTARGEENFCDTLAEHVRDFVSELALPDNASDEVKRLAKTFGLLAAAGKLAVDAGMRMAGTTIEQCWKGKVASKFR